MIHSEFELPKGLSKTINDLARTREKAAKQKYLLDLGESLVMHLAAFLIAEYKQSGILHIDLEKAFIKNNKNLSFGVYLGFIRESVKFLNTIQKPSKIHQLLMGKNDLVEIARFIKAYEAIKEAINTEKEVSLVEVAALKSKENAGKLNLLDFFNAFIELRNRVAHPHKEVKGKHITWPFNEDYFDSINPYIESAIFSAVDSLTSIWEFKIFTVNEYSDNNLLLESENGSIAEVKSGQELNTGTKVILNENQDLLLFDWKVLLKAGQEGLDAIKKEEDELRNKASVEDLKIAIKAALDDGQISRDEFTFFESLGKTKLNLSKNEIKTIIIEVANSMGIEDPFPEVDQRYIDLIDDAIKNKTYNEFLLRLSGQQYGVDSEMFNKIFEERAYALNVDPIEVKNNKVIQFTSDELSDFQGLMRTQHWLRGMGLFNQFSKESVYKLSGDFNKIETKEFAHRNAFKSLQKFVDGRINKLVIADNEQWDTKSNNWQIGTMTSYAWTAIFPKNVSSGRVLALNLTIYSDGYVHTGFLPDWKDYDQLENYGLLLHVFVNHLKEFATDFRDELVKYPNLQVWDTVNNKGVYSLLDAFDKIPWYFDYLYEFDMIQFGLTYEEVQMKPILISESFDIIFNLFSGLFEYVNRDYENLLDSRFLIFDKEASIKEKLNGLKETFSNYNLIELNNQDEQKDQEDEVEFPSGEIEKGKDNFIGSAKRGYIGLEFRKKLKGFPLIFDVKIKQDYKSNQLYFQIHISCAGYEEKQVHAPIENILLQMSEVKLTNASSYFMKSKLIICQDIEDINTFDPNEIVDEFLRNFSVQLAQQSISFFDIQPYDSLMNKSENEVVTYLNELTGEASPLFGWKIYNERNRMKGNRFVDFSSSTKKHGIHSICWGVLFDNHHPNIGAKFILEDSIKGAALIEPINDFVKQNDFWKLNIIENTNSDNELWIFSSLDESQLSASSQWNRNYSPKHAGIDNPANYWCSKESMEEQPWIQFNLPALKLLTAIKIQGAPHRKNYITQFDLHYSLDGKKWEVLKDLEGNDAVKETNEITLSKPIVVNYLKVVPTKWVGYAGLRIDFLVKDLQPDKIEMYYLVPFDNNTEIQATFKELESQLAIFKSAFGSLLTF